MLLAAEVRRLQSIKRFGYDKDMERRCLEAFDNGDRGTLQEVIDEFRAKVADVEKKKVDK